MPISGATEFWAGDQPVQRARVWRADQRMDGKEARVAAAEWTTGRVEGDEMVGRGRD